MTEKALTRADLAQNGQQPTSALAPVRLEAQSIGLMDLCTNLAKSGYFKDARDASQAVVKVLYGQELGLSPVSAMMGIHIIEGKPAPSANTLASIVKRSGTYNYRVKERSGERCTIVFFEHGEEVGEITWTLEEAKTAGLAGKDNWRKYPRQMLFARCLSEGIRTFCPDLFGGPPVYVPEELGAEVDADGEPIYHPAPVPQQPAGQTLELPARKQQPAAPAVGPSEKQLQEALRSVLDAIRAEWSKQELPGGNPEINDYGKRVLGRAPRKAGEDLAGRLEDFRQILADLSERPKMLQRCCIASQEAGISTQAEEGERHRRWMAAIVGVEVPTRKLYTSRECELCIAEAERLAQEIARLDAEAEASAQPPAQTSLYDPSADPFADE